MVDYSSIKLPGKVARAERGGSDVGPPRPESQQPSQPLPPLGGPSARVRARLASRRTGAAWRGRVAGTEAPCALAEPQRKTALRRARGTARQKSGQHTGSREIANVVFSH